jgi:hypothetical protein
MHRVWHHRSTDPPAQWRVQHFERRSAAVSTVEASSANLVSADLMRRPPSNENGVLTVDGEPWFDYRTTFDEPFLGCHTWVWLNRKRLEAR